MPDMRGVRGQLYAAAANGVPVLARAALAAVLVPLGIVCWVSLSEVRRCE